MLFFPEPEPEPEPEPDPEPVNLTPDPSLVPYDSSSDPSPDPSPVPSDPSDLLDPSPIEPCSYQRFPVNLWKKILFDQLKSRCIICDKISSSRNPLECCHIKSDHNGGLPEEKNGIMACKSCNRSMGSNNMLEWISNQWGINSEQYNRVFNYLTQNDKYTI